MGHHVVRLIVACTVLVACTTRKSETNPPQKTMVINEKEFSITIMEGGGFTGITNGFTLHSGGKVTCWEQRPGAQKTITWERMADVEPINRFRAQLASSGLMDTKIETPGNMSKTVILEDGDEPQTWIWASPDDVPASANDWYRAVNEFCRQLTP